MKKSNLVLQSIGLSLIAVTAFAAGENPFQKSLSAREGGGVHGGGGDAVTEKRIKDIRDNLLDFIARGGDKDFDFKGRLTLAEYESGNEAKEIYGMKLVLREGAVTVNAIQPEDENLSDELKNTRVDGARKICKGILSAKADGLPYIICDAKAFAKMDADAEKNADLQTIQIAHEYHSLAGIEQNHGSNSEYWLSKQLGAHMGYAQVRQLVVGKAAAAPKHPLVNQVRKFFAAKSSVRFATAGNLKWLNKDCIGVYLSANGMTSYPSGTLTDASWLAFPSNSVSGDFEAKAINSKLFSILRSPNLPYTGPGKEIPNTIETSAPDLLVGEYAGGYRFAAKLVDANTLVMEASMPSSSYEGQLVPFAGPSTGGARFVPFAYFYCHR